MINKTALKNLPLISLLAAGLFLSPAMAMADKGDRGNFKRHDSHENRHSQSNSQKHSNKHHNKHSYNKGYGHHNNQVHYKRDHHKHRYDKHRSHHTTYIVNDHHYSDYSYGLDPLRFMIGLHTNNFDIVFRD